MIKKCLICGTEFKTYPSKVKLGRGKYCSRKCSDSVTLIKKGEHRSPETEIKKGQRLRPYKGWIYQQPREGSGTYKLMHKPDHPYATKAGYIREHRLKMEEKLGRYLMPSEVVHHIDGDSLNNSIENLELLNKRDHDRRNTPLNIHKRWQRKAGGLP